MVLNGYTLNKRQVNFMHKKRTRLFPILFCIFMLLYSGVTMLSPLSPYTSIAKAHSQNIRLSKKNQKVAKGQTCKIKVKHLSKDDEVVFQINNSNVASIVSETNKSCQIKGVATGKTKLYVTVYRDREKLATLKCNITVTVPAVSVRFRTSSVTLAVSETYNLLSILNIKPKYTAEIPVFTVSDSSILNIQKNGVATALSEGSVSVTATIASGKSDTITIIVEEDS